jgi:hypothetical protein
MNSSIRKQFRLLWCRDRDLAQTKDRLTGEILHINKRGMVLLIDYPVSDESFVTLALWGERAGFHEKLLGKIKKVEPCGERSFLMGVEFMTRVRSKKLPSPWQPGHYHMGDKFIAGTKVNHHRQHASGSALRVIS